MNFYKFLESRLLVENEESGFIRSFFQSFKNLNSYEKTTLGVFADWLEDRDDPRSALVRMAFKSNDLAPNGWRYTAAQRLGIGSSVIENTEWSDYGDTIYFYVKGEDPYHTTKPVFIIGEPKESGWHIGKKKLSRDKEDYTITPVAKVDLSKINDNFLEIFFWSLLGYGWEYRRSN